MCCALLSAACTCCSCCISGASCCSKFGGGGKGGFAKQIYWAILLLTVLAQIGLYFGFASLPAQATFYSYGTCYVGNSTTASCPEPPQCTASDPLACYRAATQTYKCTDEGLDQSRKNCISNYTVYRLSFALAMFFLAICVGSICSTMVHRGLWVIKIIAYLVLVTATFFIPNDFFYGYEWVARVLSAFFLVLQIVILIDFCYDLSEFIMDKAEEDNGVARDDPKACCNCGPTGWKVVFLVLSGLCLVTAIVGVVLLFVHFGQCGHNIAFIVITIVLGVATTILSLLNQVNGGLLTPSAVFAYSTYMCYQALSAQPNTSITARCNPLKGAAGENTDVGGVIVGLVIAACALTWTTARTTNSAPNLFKRGDHPNAEGKNNNNKGGGGEGTEMTPQQRKKEREERKKRRAQEKAGKGNEIAHDGTAAGEDDVAVQIEPTQAAGSTPDPNTTSADGDTIDAEPSTGKQGAWFFHLIMFLGAVYSAMLITKWTHFDPNVAHYSDAEDNTSMWVKIIAQWVTYAIYLWTMVAPLCCPSRDFGDTYNSIRGY